MPHILQQAIGGSGLQETMDITGAAERTSACPPLSVRLAANGFMSVSAPTDTLRVSTCQSTQVGSFPRSSRHDESVPSRLLRWFTNARSHRVICLLLGVWLLNAFDLALTVIAHGQGLLVEQNPIARQMLDNGIVSIILYKIGLVCIGTYPLLKFRKHRIAEMGTMIAIVAYAMLAVHWDNCYRLYTAAGTNG